MPGQSPRRHATINAVLRAAIGGDGAPQADKQSFIWTDANGDGEPSVDTLPNGEVLWLANGWNNSSVYRITGWDGWERATGKPAS